jgi:hypothetical protein
MIVVVVMTVMTKLSEHVVDEGKGKVSPIA